MTVLWIASFDIGKKNFSFYIEEIELEKIEKFNLSYNIDGTPTDNTDEYISKMCSRGNRILLDNVDLCHGCDNRLYLDPKVFVNMTQLLDLYGDYWKNCDIILIEKQMSFGKGKTNTMALKIGQHCYSYFSIKYPTAKIIEFPAYLKTQVLGAAKVLKNSKYQGMDKPARKKWCECKAIEVLELRNDVDGLCKIRKAKKKDDMADVICQLQAFKLNLKKYI